MCVLRGCVWFLNVRVCGRVCVYVCVSCVCKTSLHAGHCWCSSCCRGLWLNDGATEADREGVGVDVDASGFVIEGLRLDREGIIVGGEVKVVVEGKEGAWDGKAPNVCFGVVVGS